jgi:hypothetical protein
VVVRRRAGWEREWGRVRLDREGRTVRWRASFSSVRLLATSSAIESNEFLETSEFSSASSLWTARSEKDNELVLMDGRPRLNVDGGVLLAPRPGKEDVDEDGVADELAFVVVALGA